MLDHLPNPTQGQPIVDESMLETRSGGDRIGRGPLSAGRLFVVSEVHAWIAWRQPYRARFADPWKVRAGCLTLPPGLLHLAIVPAQISGSGALFLGVFASFIDARANP